jgi:hypothetical protein
VQLKEKEPHSFLVSEDNGFQAEFKVGIIQTAKKDAVSILREKYEGICKENTGTKKLISKQLCDIKKRAESEALEVRINMLLIPLNSYV